MEKFNFHVEERRVGVASVWANSEAEARELAESDELKEIEVCWRETLVCYPLHE